MMHEEGIIQQKADQIVEAPFLLPMMQEGTIHKRVEQTVMATALATRKPSRWLSLLSRNITIIFHGPII